MVSAYTASWSARNVASRATLPSPHCINCQYGSVLQCEGSCGTGICDSCYRQDFAATHLKTAAGVDWNKLKAVSYKCAYCVATGGTLPNPMRRLLTPISLTFVSLMEDRKLRISRFAEHWLNPWVTGIDNGINSFVGLKAATPGGEWRKWFDKHLRSLDSIDVYRNLFLRGFTRVTDRS